MGNTLELRNINLNQTNITGRRNPVVQVIETRTRYKIDPQTRQRTDELDGFTVTILAALSRPQDVKVPIETENVIKQIDDALRDEKQVFVTFGTPSSTLRGKPYAMINSSGKLVSGISCTATEIQISRIEDNIDDFDEIIIE